MASVPIGRGVLYVGDVAPTDVGDFQVDTTSSTTDVDLVVVTGVGVAARVANGTVAATAAVSAHVALADPHVQYQKESEKDAASGYAGLSAASRITKGVITTDDLIVDDSPRGLVLKDTQGTPHYWRVTVSTLGALTTADLGTSPP